MGNWTTLNSNGSVVELEQNDSQFADDIFECMFLKVYLDSNFTEVQLLGVQLKSSLDYKMAWCPQATSGLLKMI